MCAYIIKILIKDQFLINFVYTAHGTRGALPSKQRP